MRDGASINRGMMMEDQLLTPQEVADMLKIKKNTVYFMIKRGDLKAAKMGKQIRIRLSDVEAYLGRDAGGEGIMEPAGVGGAAVPENVPCYSNPEVRHSYVMSGQDEILDMICNRTNRNPYGIQMMRAYLGSYNGLYAMYQGQVMVATCHLWDPATDTYNIPYLSKILPGQEIHAFHLCRRMEGFYVQKGNPKHIRDFHDLGREDVVFLNREKGSGTRVLLDGMLQALKIDPARLRGYDRVVNSHLVAASTVARKGADFALGAERAGLQIADVDFIPLKQEDYDMVVFKRDMGLPVIQRLIQTVQSPDFMEEVKQFEGYDTSEMGRQLL